MFKLKFSTDVDLTFSEDRQGVMWNTPDGILPVKTDLSRVVLNRDTIPKFTSSAGTVHQFSVVYDNDVDVLILECKNERRDKTTPNFFTVVEASFRAALDRIDMDLLLRELGPSLPHQRQTFMQEHPISFSCSQMVEDVGGDNSSKKINPRKRTEKSRISQWKLFCTKKTARDNESVSMKPVLSRSILL
jgi:hypothetical protein